MEGTNVTPEARLLARLRRRFPFPLPQSATDNAKIAQTGDRSYRVPDPAPRTLHTMENGAGRVHQGGAGHGGRPSR